MRRSRARRTPYPSPFGVGLRSLTLGRDKTGAALLARCNTGDKAGGFPAVFVRVVYSPSICLLHDWYFSAYPCILRDRSQVVVVYMPILFVNFDADVFRRISRLVGRGEYETPEAFVALAVRNQLLLEEADHTRGDTTVASGRSSAVRTPHSVWVHHPVEKTRLAAARPTAGLLWGQIYRLLPLKLVIRVCTGIDMTRAASLRDAEATIASAALQLGEWLAEQETPNSNRSAPSLAVGWPNRKRNEPASKARFIAQYFARFDRAGKLHGLAGDLGFAGLSEDGCGPVLTAQAVEFSAIPNPVIDAFRTDAAFSEDERAYLVEHIARNMPGEAEHMRRVLGILGHSGASPSQLDDKLGPFYRQVGRASSAKEVSLMRSGAIGRLGELGLVSTLREGTKALYTRTDNAVAIASSLLSSAAVRSGARAEEEGQC
jgi:hypothetical protein